MDSVREVEIKEFEIEDIPLSCTWVIIGAPGSGKCSKKGTEVLLYNGEIKRVEEIKVGDLLMGDDSTPRHVTKLFQGREKLFKVQPQDHTAPYYVTGGHTLCLRYNTRPSVKMENGRWPRYRVIFADTFIDENGLSKIKQTNVNFSVGKYTEEGAKELATKKCEELTKQYNLLFPLHEVEVENYIKQSKTLNHRLVAYRTGVEFEKYNSQEIDPYLLGAWLGDGTSADTSITNIDPEMIDYFYTEAEKMNMKITRFNDTEKRKGSMLYYFTAKGSHKKGSNTFLNFLKNNNLIKNKHIPQNYKVNSRKNRLALLAGLIDTDGHYGNQSYYEIYQKNERLAKDIVFVARSLGFWCHIRPVEKGCLYKGEMRMGTYQKVTFGGDDLHELPILIPRKMATLRLDRLAKDALHYKIEVTEDEEDDYYGFEVSGNNHRFLLGDFTVTHNCLAPGTPVTMFDKTIKNVEDIQEGELLAGDDEKPRVVLSTCSGNDKMYRVSQNKGEDYTVNAPHILVLKNTRSGGIEEITAEEFAKLPQEIRSIYKGYKLSQEGNHIESDITITEIGNGKYHGFQINENGRFLLGDRTVTHNTTLIENICYYHKHRYPVARVFMGTEAGYQKFCEIFHPLYVSNYYDEEQEKSHILRQRTCVLENGKDYQGNMAINILDDVADNPQIFKTKLMKGIFKLGSQHWNQLFMLGTQYAIDMPPDIRKATSYVAIFREPEEIERKKLYANFGGLAGSYNNFCDLMDQLTGDFTCLIFKKRSQSNEIEDCIFWYKGNLLKPWKFGCKEYRSWAKDRYDTNYVEKIMM